MTDIRGSPISDFDLEYGLWSCHCCGKVNDIKRKKCIICGRNAGYSTAEYKPFHGNRMLSMTRTHVFEICKEDESQRGKAEKKPCVNKETQRVRYLSTSVFDQGGKRIPCKSYFCSSHQRR